jgi:hypothetical protein
MPTVFIEGYKFRFYSSDFREPPHVHIFRGEKQAKIWLQPTEVQANYGYNQAELNKILQLTIDHRQQLLEIWNDHFSQ